MTLINFARSEFVKSVSDGSKNFTIRKMRKHPFNKGEKLQLYTGLRSRHAIKLRDAVCKNVWDLRIEEHEGTFLFKLNGRRLSYERVNGIARKVGFRTVDLWISYFKEKYEFPFEGQLIEWN
ncbi:MAG: hypothetical protein J7604_20580 [Sporocytophaga sp.]|uniref:hypothetical protein n=1 Tax=Sporocytophaga sp. TaxID=2231183 RepID=UPI001B06D4B8|nr:hypothetical protein [Sporocytophaga sp.]MBO9702620.1 hypothetical protein [Sporocytophaga sp.]